MAAPYFSPPTPGPSPTPKRSALGVFALVGLVVLCLGAGGILVYMNFAGSDETDTEAEAGEKPKRIAAVPVNEGTADPEENLADFTEIEDEVSSTITVSITTTPEGAEVFRAGESVGTTPINETFDRSEPEVWQIFLEGYEVTEVPVPLDDDFEAHLVLDEQPADAPAVKAPGTERPKKTKTADGSAGGSGDKPKKKKKAKEEGGRTVITGTTGAVIPD